MKKNTRIILAIIAALLIGYFLMGNDAAAPTDEEVEVVVDQAEVSGAETGETQVNETPNTATSQTANPQTSGQPAQPSVTQTPVAPSTLTSQSWKWQETIKTAGEGVVPDSDTDFLLTMSADGTFSTQTDCNAVSGVYQVADSVLTFGQMVSTKMACEGSQEKDFTDALAQTQRYSISAEGNLELGLMLGMGTVILTPVTQ